MDTNKNYSKVIPNDDKENVINTYQILMCKA